MSLVCVKLTKTVSTGITWGPDPSMLIHIFIRHCSPSFKDSLCHFPSFFVISPLILCVSAVLYLSFILESFLLGEDVQDEFSSKHAVPLSFNFHSLRDVVSCPHHHLCGSVCSPLHPWWLFRYFLLHQDLSGNFTDVSVVFPGPTPCTFSANMKTFQVSLLQIRSSHSLDIGITNGLESSSCLSCLHISFEVIPSQFHCTSLELKFRLLVISVLLLYF